MKSAIKILWILSWRVGILLALWQAALLAGVAEQISSAESNLVSNQIGIQEVARKRTPDLVLIGSSLSMRLDAGVVANQTGFPEVIQMGLNGGRSLLGLQLLENLGVEAGGLVIETNSLANSENVNEETLLNHSEEGVFYLARVIPWVRARNRPSSIIYHQLKKWRDNRLNSLPGRTDEEGSGFAGPGPGTPSPKARKKAEAIALKIACLGVPWNRILLVMLPDRGADRSEAYEIARILVENYGARILDLKGREEPGEYRYADGVHLDAPSGKRASIQVGRMLQKMGVAACD